MQIWEFNLKGCWMFSDLAVNWFQMRFLVLFSFYELLCWHDVQKTYYQRKSLRFKSLDIYQIYRFEITQLNRTGKEIPHFPVSSTFLGKLILVLAKYGKLSIIFCLFPNILTDFITEWIHMIWFNHLNPSPGLGITRHSWKPWMLLTCHTYSTDHLLILGRCHKLGGDTCWLHHSSHRGSCD